jgi:tRNA (cmo5U34)-methyltransferase
MDFVELFAGDRARQFEANIRARIPGYEVVLQTATAQIARSRTSGRILSVGCGSGQDVIALARRPSYQVTAIDPSADMVTLAGERFRAEGILGIDLRCCTVSELPDEPRYDAALLCFVLHFIPDDGAKDRLLEQIAQRLRPGGELVLLDFCRTADHAADMRALRVYLEWFSRMPAAEADAYVARIRNELHLLAPEAYVHRGRQAGFSTVRTFYSSLHVRGLLFEKDPA